MNTHPIVLVAFTYCLLQLVLISRCSTAATLMLLRLAVLSENIELEEIPIQLSQEKWL